jgi:hypothetical protein
VPTDSVEQQDGVCSAYFGPGDLVEVELHRVRVGEGQREPGGGAAGRADGAEQALS